MPMLWQRDTKWHQGSILSSQSLVALDPPELTEINKESMLAVAISHSCDIASDISKEPYIEFILCRTIAKSDGNYTFSKNTRVLHLEITAEDAPKIFELISHQRFKASKQEIFNYEPDEQFTLDSTQINILQDWLAARYRRQALPESLQNRMHPLVTFLSEEGKKHPRTILAYYIDYDPRDLELAADQPYDLSIYIVYPAENANLGKEAKDIALKIESKFSKLINKTADLGPIQLLNCKAYSEEEFTLGDMRRNIRYLLEHLSYRIDPPGPTI